MKFQPGGKKESEILGGPADGGRGRGPGQGIRREGFGLGVWGRVVLRMGVGAGRDMKK